MTALGEHADLPAVSHIDGALAPLAHVRFTPAPPRGRRGRRSAPPCPYDESITLGGTVPTRERNVHDLMNALVWAVFPRAKRALHARQHELVTRAGRPRHGESQSRTREGDALAMLDEGGLLVLASRARAHEVEASCSGRDAEGVAAITRAGEARAIAFGHALYEHVARALAITPLGMTVVLPVDAPVSAVPLVEVDRQLASMIEDRSLFLENGVFGSIPFASSVWGEDR